MNAPQDSFVGRLWVDKQKIPEISAAPPKDLIGRYASERGTDFLFFLQPAASGAS